MKKKRFPIWASEEQIKSIKENAKKESRSASNYLINRALASPNLATGDWWDNKQILVEAIKRLEKKKK